jgi:glycosyltransferase involved in cell wall biosynthesis
MSDKKKSIILVTSNYPFNYGDADFIRSEILYLANTFNRIHIIYKHKSENIKALHCPKNVVVHDNSAGYNYSGIKKISKKIFTLFSPIFIREIFLLHKKNMLTKKTAYKAACFLFDSFRIRKQIEKVLLLDKSIRIIYTYWYSFETLASLLLKKKYFVKCVTRTHRSDLYENVSEIGYQYYKTWMDKKLDKIFFISKHGYDYYLNYFAVSDFSKYSLSMLGTHNRYNMNFQKGPAFTLVSCSAIIPVKRVHLIVRALAEIDNIAICWVHIGDGSERDGIIDQIQKLLNNKNNISTSFVGSISNEKVLELYSKNYFDCFISCSESEGLPVSMMEALSFGIPIIATNVGGVPEIVNNQTGILLDAKGDIQEIKSAIIEFYNFSNEKILSMRKAARSLWESDFNAETNYQKFAETLAELT